MDTALLALLEAPAEFHGNRYTSGAVYNIHDTSRPAGTTRQYALRKLRTGRPDLHTRFRVVLVRAFNVEFGKFAELFDVLRIWTQCVQII